MVSKTKRKTSSKSRSRSYENSDDSSAEYGGSGGGGREMRPRQVDNKDSTGRSSSFHGDSHSIPAKTFSSSASVSSVSSSSSSSSSSREEWFHTPLFKQSLLVSIVFVLGLYSGIAYVGRVQHQYGFGQNAVLERRYLPYGPVTFHACERCQQHTTTTTAAAASNNSIVVPQPATNNKKKGIRLNRDHPQRQPSAVVPTLFGMEYDHLVGPNSDDETTARTTNTNTDGQSPAASNTHQPRQKASAASRHDISPDLYQLASTRQVSLAPSEAAMIQTIGNSATTYMPDLHQRAAQVSWGGPHHAEPATHWWFPVPAAAASDSNASDLSKLEGGHLLYAYLFIMKWNPHPQFPFRLCGEQGCPPERAMAHTLEWREKYKPWLVPPSVLRENEKGYVYHRGLSPIHNSSSGDDDESTTGSSSTGKHGTVVVRLNHKVQNDLSFFRGILHSADRAIADALKESNGEVGKFNVIFDCQGFSLSHAPTIHALKQGVTMLQDHYPNRLGMIFLSRLSRVGEVFLRVVLGLITKEVRDKIKILPHHDQAKSMAILKMVLEEESIPDYMGGTDTYRFSVDSYYPPEYRCTEDEAQEFLTTMPYHAK